MKKSLLFLLLLYSYFLPAKQIVDTIEEVKIDSRIVSLITAFVEYESACEFYKEGYPKDNILSLNMMRFQLLHNDSAALTPVIDFYPDIICEHEYANIKYVAYVNIHDSTYNIYIELSEDDKHLWEQKQIPLPFKPTGHHVIVTKKEGHPYEYECDPPFIRIWYITNKHRIKNGFYIENGFSNYCW